jgi:hypothetical protein
MTDLAKLRIWNDAAIASVLQQETSSTVWNVSPLAVIGAARLEERLREVPIASDKNVSRLMRRRGHIEYCYR